MDAKSIVIIAGQEQRVTRRAKWVQIFAVTFALLTLAISYFGMATSVVVGFEGFTRTTASLLNLVLYLVPLIALTAGALSFSGERGAAEMLFAQPVLRSEVLLGKVLGLFSSLATAVIFGFAVSGMVISVRTGLDGIFKYLGFLALTLLLLLTFVGLGALAAVISEGRARALGVALSTWFLFVLFYDLITVGLALLVNPHLSHNVLLVSLFGNPVDLVRVSGLLILGGATIFGTAGAGIVRALGTTAFAIVVLSTAVVLWTLLIMLLAAWRLGRREI
jgi:Cu-processing system permease protein